ncbi:hypothetical protein MMC07_000963 [Pseudocyphellaria aurata]|nr:hypothetical protein [Pseudocyphellaria aurata]
MDDYNSYLGPYPSLESIADFLNENQQEAFYDSVEGPISTNAFNLPLDPQMAPAFGSGFDLGSLQPHHLIDPNLVANNDFSEEEAMFKDMINVPHPTDSKNVDSRDHSGYDGHPGKLPTSSVTTPIGDTKPIASRMERKASVVDVAGSDGVTRKGRVNLLPGGGLEWSNNGDWIPAVYHDTLRPELIQLTDLLGSYENLRARGRDEWDRTSYHPDQKRWGPCRFRHWPHMPDKLLFRLECNGYPVPDYKPEIWLDRGRVVLDSDNHPVKAWANIPLTLASNADPWLLEYIRRVDTRITLKDLRARMPLQVTDKKGNLKPLRTLSALGMQMTRFRISAACPAWNMRQGSDTIRDYVVNLLSDEGLAANSTEELHGLSPWQQAECKQPNKGQFLTRASGRALSADERQRRDDVERRRLEKKRPLPKAEDVEVMVAQPAVHRRGSRALTVAPTASPVGFSRGGPSIAVQSTSRKRTHDDTVDEEALDASLTLKRRNLGANPCWANSSVENVISRLAQLGQTRVLSPRRRHSVNAEVPRYQGTIWESNEQDSASNPPPRAALAANAILSNYLNPNLYCEDNFSLTGQPGPQRKRSHAIFAKSEDDERPPTPKRRILQGFAVQGERPMQRLPARRPCKHVPRLPRRH